MNILVLTPEEAKILKNFPSKLKKIKKAFALIHLKIIHGK